MNSLRDGDDALAALRRMNDSIVRLERASQSSTYQADELEEFAGAMRELQLRGMDLDLTLRVRHGLVRKVLESS